MEIREYVTQDDRSPFGEWFAGLGSPASEKVAAALYRLGIGNLSNVKSVGSGVLEFRINFGPGYRIYFSRDGAMIVVLLGGGTKQRQERDIRQAIERWADYRGRRRAREWC